MQSQADSPSALRNRQPIADRLVPLLSPGQRVLEVASGTGTHVHFFAGLTPQVHWQPSEPDTPSRDLLSQRLQQAPLPNIAAPLGLNVEQRPWPVSDLNAVLAINLLHISPATVMQNLAAGAIQHLTPGGRLLVYGPFARNGTHTSPSNEAFDLSLQQRNSAWGIRALETFVDICADAGLDLTTRVDMPANNQWLVFAR